MNYSTLLIALLIALGAAYFLGRNRARSLAGQGESMHSLPTHYGALTALWTLCTSAHSDHVVMLEPRIVDAL